jgi:predicted HicB family RNase H-like nuclease
MMEYKGYIGRVEYDGDSDTFHGVVVGTRDVITFEGRSVEELHEALKDSVDTYLEVCKEAGKSPERPCSGNFVVRIDPELHRAIATLAALSDTSLNAWVAEVFKTATSQAGRAGKVEKPRRGRSARGKRSPANTKAG